MDLFVVPTISFRLLYGLLILHHNRRQMLWLGVTAHPTAEFTSLKVVRSSQREQPGQPETAVNMEKFYA